MQPGDTLLVLIPLGPGSSTVEELHVQIDIITMTNGDPRFYPPMGLFLANRVIAGELDMHGELPDVWGKRWWLAIAGSSRGLIDDCCEVRGFCAAVAGPDEIRFENFWVTAVDRGKGIGRRLFQTRLDYFAGTSVPLVGYCSDQSWPLYRQARFRVVDEGTSRTGHHWRKVQR